MTSRILYTKFHTIKVPLLDNAPGHPDMDELRGKMADGYIEVMYLLINTTALIQHMDQNVMKTLKVHYKSAYLWIL